MSDEETQALKEQRDDAFRAIGRYVVEFSELVREMRTIAAQHIGGAEKWVLANIALGEATATPIAHAFFALCREHASLTADERKVANVLSGQVEQAIRTRNDVAHGDWQIGYLALGASGMVEGMPPRTEDLTGHMAWFGRNGGGLPRRVQRLEGRARRGRRVSSRW